MPSGVTSSHLVKLQTARHIDAGCILNCWGRGETKQFKYIDNLFLLTWTPLLLRISNQNIIRVNLADAEMINYCAYMEGCLIINYIAKFRGFLRAIRGLFLPSVLLKWKQHLTPPIDTATFLSSVDVLA